MTHTLQKLLFLLTAMVFALLSPISAVAVHEPTDEFYIADYADVLSPELEQEIINSNNLLYEQTGAQIVIATIRYLEDGYHADEYAVQLFDSWGVGSSSENNGILILLVTEEAKAWVTQGSGIKHQLSNDDISELLDDHFWKPYDKGDFDKAVEQLFDELIDWYENHYNFTLGETATDNSSTVTVNDAPAKSGGRVFRVIFKFILIAAIFMAMNSLGSLLARKTARRSSNYSQYNAPRSTYSRTSYRPPVRPTGGPRTSGRTSSGSTRPRSGFNSGQSSRSRSSRPSGGGGRSGGGGAGRR